jgi:hypothetical protein
MNTPTNQSPLSQPATLETVKNLMFLHFVATLFYSSLILVAVAIAVHSIESSIKSALSSHPSGVAVEGRTIYIKEDRFDKIVFEGQGQKMMKWNREKSK